MERYLNWLKDRAGADAQKDDTLHFLNRALIAAGITDAFAKNIVANLNPFVPPTDPGMNLEEKIIVAGLKNLQALIKLHRPKWIWVLVGVNLSNRVLAAIPPEIGRTQELGRRHRWHPLAFGYVGADGHELAESYKSLPLEA
jgi:hypothetical protein